MDYKGNCISYKYRKIKGLAFPHTYLFKIVRVLKILIFVFTLLPVCFYPCFQNVSDLFTCR